MKAIICTRYGLPEVLQLQEVPRPEPKDNEVSIKIHATAVTASDCIVRGFKMPRWHPLGIMMSLMIGITRPRNPILGMVLSGEVEAAGWEVTRFKAGDQVFGSTLNSKGVQIRFGAYAEYTCLPESSLITHKPENISFAEAAAIPYGAGIAMFYLQKGNVQAGQNVLIYVASGAIGTNAVQLAKARGAQVTGVCSTTNLDMVKSLGADEVIDYTVANAPPAGAQYDVILDAVGRDKTSPFKEQCE